MQGTLLSSEARIASAISEEQNTPAGQRGVLLFLSASVIPEGGEPLALVLEAKDPASGKFTPIKEQSINVGEMEAAKDGLITLGIEFLPRKWRVQVTTEDGDEWTYSVGASPLQ